MRRGGGLFNILSGIAKRAMPFLMKNVAPEAIKMGKNVLGDVIEGRQLRHSLKNRGMQALEGVGKRVLRGGRVRKSKRSNKKKIKSKISRACYKKDIFSPDFLV